MEVDVLVQDTRGPRLFPFGGHYPPPLSDWQERGWEILSQFERPLDGIGGRLPVWCRDPGAGKRPELSGRFTHWEPHRILH